MQQDSGNPNFSDAHVNPYAQSDQSPSNVPPKKSSLKFWLILFGVLGTFTLLLCCGGPIGAFYWSIGFLEKTVDTRLRDNPVVREHLGEIEPVSYNFQATGETGQTEGQGILVFDAKGSKSSGLIKVRLAGDQIIWAELEMPSGETFELIE